MEDLLTKYSGAEIILFLVFFIVALKELISYVDWFKNRIKSGFDKDYNEKEKDKQVEEEIKKLEQFYNEKKVVDEGFENMNKALSETNARIDSLIQTMNQRIDTLVESDKEAIKSYITEKHHYFVYDKEWIDDYNLECLEKRFKIYTSEHGNSFVEGLMNEIRDLPKQPPNDIESKYVGTAEYVNKAKNKK